MADNHEQKITDVMRGIHHAAATASAMAIDHFQSVIKEHFIEDKEKGTLTPKTITIVVDGNSYTVPTVALYSHRTVLMKRLVVEMSVRVDEVDIKKLDNNLSRSSLRVTLGPRVKDRGADIINITAEFEDSEPPEGYARLIDEVLNRVSNAHNNGA